MPASDRPLPLIVALGLSLALHLGIGFLARSMATMPQIDFELAMPDQVEFGMTEAMDTVEVATAPVESTPEGDDPAEDGTGGEDGSDGEGIDDPTEDGTDAGVASADAGVGELDAGVPFPDGGNAEDEQDAGREGLEFADGSVPMDAEMAADAGVDQGAARPLVARATVRGPSRIPAGAQLALRLDMARIRASSVSEDVRALIGAVPDWREFLGGSGIDPLNDLDRVLIATPNRYRSRILLAGRHVHDEDFTRAAVDRMADARGTTAQWSQRHGVLVAPWANEGPTERVLAMLSPRHFTVSRPEDLPTALSMAEARAARNADDEGLEEATGPDALLSMGPEEGLSLEVEGLHNFIAAGNLDLIPTRARLAVRQVSESQVAIEGLAVYPDAASAEVAVSYWTRQRDAALGSMGIRILAGPHLNVLSSIRFEVEDERVRIHASATDVNVRFALNFVQRQFEAWERERERRRAAATMSTSPPTPPTPADRDGGT